MKPLSIYLSQRNDLTLLQRFAFTGVTDVFNQHISNLASMAEEEPWSIEYENDILKAYINKTFEKCYQQNDVAISDDEQFSYFDTGLLSLNFEKIFCLFIKNNQENPFWKLKGFYVESDHLIMANFPNKPNKADYFSNPQDYFFNPKVKIIPNTIHFFDEEENVYDRFPDKIKELPKEDFVALIKGKIDILISRIERNPRIAIPLYYKDEFSFACPIKILDFELALIIGKYDANNYRVNTIFPLDITYKKARMLMRPEANWLKYSKKTQ